MLLHPADYAFTSKVERGFEIISRELLALTSADFLEWPDRSAYGGNWLVAPLFMSSRPSRDGSSDICCDSGQAERRLQQRFRERQLASRSGSRHRSRCPL